MREILFRGKRLDNGEWVEGFYVALKLVHYDRIEHLISDKDTGKSYDIDTATVGQYTGMTDKNGKRIFEGDILKVNSGFWEGDTFLTKVWAEGSTLCVNVQGEDYDYTAINFADDLWSNAGDEPEVVGNIHDNPELVEGGEG